MEVMTELRYGDKSLYHIEGTCTKQRTIEVRHTKKGRQTINKPYIETDRQIDGQTNTEIDTLTTIFCCAASLSVSQ